jgi:hypothetical protein
MRFNFLNLFFLFFIFNDINSQLTNWWIYEPVDFDVIMEDVDILEDFLEDQINCILSEGQCPSVNSQLISKPPFDNKCCFVKVDQLNGGCLTIFSGKYHNTNLYSLDINNKGFSYDCNGNGYKTFDSSKFSPTQKWEEIIKEKLDCIYSEDENKCKANPKSFKENTKCCWFDNDQYSAWASCFGLSEITDPEFNRTVPYLALAFMTEEEMDFRCYDKSDKVVKGKFNLNYNIAEMGSVKEKLNEEMKSDEALRILDQKENYVGVKEPLNGTSFQIWVISPRRGERKFTVSVKYNYEITSSKVGNHRRLAKTEEKIARCTTKDENNNLNLTSCECELTDTNDLPGNLEIQPGHDLIGNFESGKNRIDSTGAEPILDADIDKIKNAPIFTFENPVSNLQSTTIEGTTTEDRKNMKFIIYHQNGDELQTIKATGNFLKNEKKIEFTPDSKIDFNNGITIIPNQLCSNDDGEYLYIKNKVPERISSSGGSSDSYSRSASGRNTFPKKKTGLSKGGIIALIIVGSILAICVLAASILIHRNTRNLSNPQIDSATDIVIPNGK